MLNIFREIRSEERKAVFGAFFTLFAIMISHALLETARDALFLAKISPTRLPWVYLGIAAVAFALVQIETGLLKKFESRRALAISLAISGFVTLAIWVALGRTGVWIYYLTYVWSGVMATLIIVRFWALVSDIFTVSQAKRLYAVIGIGSVLGAITGAAFARFLTNWLPVENLLLGAGVVLVVTAFAPLLVETEFEEEAQPSRLDLVCDTEAGCIRNVLSRPYVSRLLALMVISTVALTLVDYLFKTIVASRIPAERLGEFFSQTYLILNLLSLFIQVFLVRRLIRALGLNRVVTATPIILGVTMIALFGLQIFAAGLVLVGILATKGVDGSLRYSLGRTATEMLYVPLSREVRARAKSFIDVVGQRGGQAIGSLLILIVGIFDPNLITIIVIATFLIGAWVWIGFDLRTYYLDLFRNTLDEGHFKTRIEYPDLDMASIETLVETLNSPKDSEVIAAFELLVAQARDHLIPALILYHPSPKIVINALNLFSKTKRQDAIPIAKRLIEHSDPEVRAGALRATIAISPEHDALERYLEDPSPAVRATALVGLITSGRFEDKSAENVIREFAGGESTEKKIALANAIEAQPNAHFISTLLALAKSSDGSVRIAVANAMRQVGDESFLPTLLDMLDDRNLREAAQIALTQFGDVALNFLDSALGDCETPVAIRRQIPRVIRGFDAVMAAPILTRYMSSDSDGIVRYKILRALGGLRSSFPNLPLNENALSEAADSTMTRAYRLLDWRLRLERGISRDPARDTSVSELLVATLKDKENETIERIFRVLGLIHPNEDFQRIHAGTTSHSRALKSSSMELLDGLIENPLRDAVLGFLEEIDDESRLKRAGEFYNTTPDGYLDVLAELLDNGGLAVRCLTVYHIGELGIEEMEARLVALEPEPSGFLETVVARASELIAVAQKRRISYE